MENIGYNNAGERLQSIVSKKPGIRFMELQREAGISHGTLQYYMKKLSKRNFLRIKREGKVTRIFPREFSEYEMNIMGFLRLESSRQLLLTILSNGGVTFKELVNSIKPAASTTSWHLHKMKEKRIIDFQRGTDGYLHYYVIDRQKVIDLLSKHHDGFMDEYVDNFISSSYEL